MSRHQSLFSADAGVALEVVSLSCPPDCARRLQELGFVQNAVLRKLWHNGNIICSILGCRIAIQAELGHSITVRPACAVSVPTGEFAPQRKSSASCYDEAL